MWWYYLARTSKTFPFYTSVLGPHTISRELEYYVEKSHLRPFGGQYPGEEYLFVGGGHLEDITAG